MSNLVSYIITDHNITVNYQGQTHIVPRTDALADRLIKAVREKRTQEIPSLVSAAKRIEAYGQGNFVVQDGNIFINGVQAPVELGAKIVRFSSEGLPHEPLVKFAENLLKNPSYRAVQELFQFLEKNNHPITNNGCFIAYKKVRADFKDAYTGTMDNSIGKVVEMPRNQVNEDPTQTCSHGLHVANWSYAHDVYKAGDDPVMLEVEVNPADVVAVPVDYDQAKMRVCAYKVLGVVDQEHSSDVSLRVVPTNKCEPITEETDKKTEEIDEEECPECGSVYCLSEECLQCIGCDEWTNIPHSLCAVCEEEEENTEVELESTDLPEDRYPWDDEIETE